MKLSENSGTQYVGIFENYEYKVLLSTNAELMAENDKLHVLSERVHAKNKELEAELLRVKSENSGINYFGTYDHMRLSGENVQLKAELDAVKHEKSMFHGEILSARYEVAAHKKESAQVIGCLEKDIRRLLEEGGNLQKELNEYKQRVNMENVYKMQRDDLLKLSKQQDAEIEQLSKDRHDTERELMHAKEKIDELKREVASLESQLEFKTIFYKSALREIEVLKYELSLKK